MVDFAPIQSVLKRYRSLEGAREFFSALGYPAMDPLPLEMDRLPRGALEPIANVHQIVHIGDGSPFRIYHVELAHDRVRRTDIRRFLESFYRNFPQGENLFVFTPRGHFDELVFVSPNRIRDPRDSSKVRLWLRILQVQREHPYRTDLEVLSGIQAHGITDPEQIWERHREAFSVQRVTEQFFRDYCEMFQCIRDHLMRTHPNNDVEWARDYTHQLLNRIMFLYFIARKGCLPGTNEQPDRYFMRHFWEAYRSANGKSDTFYTDWLSVLFFEALNRKWLNHAMYLERFPSWLVNSFSRAPFLNGGLYAQRPDLDGRLVHPLPDEIFELLFERWIDGTTPGLFERYNFTVVESGRFDEEVAVDPEMLGMVYERLVNVTFRSSEEEVDLRGQAGIFYTPRTEIDLMCRLALVDWLQNHLGRPYEALLYQWVFAFSEEERQEADTAVTCEGLWERLDELIRRVRVCDPACGSGSFLVGMMLVLDDLQARCNAVLGRDETPYERRKRILQDQIYGVDVMEWAVRVAELRLWLQLVVETELYTAEWQFKPLLPNLNFKLRPGDSLLQTVGDLDFSPFRRAELHLSRQLKGRLVQLKGKKRRFFQGEDHRLTEAELKKEELDLFRDILAYNIHELDNLLKQKQTELRALSSAKKSTLVQASTDAQDASVQQRLRDEINTIRKKLAQYRQAYRTLRPDRPVPFVWDIAFVEVFEEDRAGFDIVIGNPPYVSQGKIWDPLKRFNREEYLQRLNGSLRAIYPDFMSGNRRVSGRADYYIYFYLHGLSLVADRGTFCFITSNSWLDADYGKDLQEFLLRYGHVKMIIDNRAKRSFSQADVNTVIVLLGPPERNRPLTEEEMKARSVRFVAFRVPFEEVMSSLIFTEIADESLYRPMAGFRILVRPEYRSVLWDQWSLYLDGLTEPDTPTSGRSTLHRSTTGAHRHRAYVGNKWGGKFLRAPDIYFTILEKGQRYRVFLSKDKPMIVEDITDILED